MPITSRLRRPLPRDTGKLRDARLFIIATEDTCAPKQYMPFVCNHPRLHVEVLETHAGHSSPTHVIERLKAFAEKYDLKETDQLWALLDTDHWIKGSHKPGLISALTTAKQAGLRVAMSNPCFDLWLLLHHEAVVPGSAFADCDSVGARIRHLCGEFNKTNLKPEHYPISNVTEACARASALEPAGINPLTDFWPESTGTRVYLLIAELQSCGLVL